MIIEASSIQVFDQKIVIQAEESMTLRIPVADERRLRVKQVDDLTDPLRSRYEIDIPDDMIVEFAILRFQHLESGPFADLGEVSDNNDSV